MKITAAMMEAASAKLSATLGAQSNEEALREATESTPFIFAVLMASANGTEAGLMTAMFMMLELGYEIGHTQALREMTEATNA